MKLIAILESWVIPDGSYPPFAVGMPVNLSFEMAVRQISINAAAEDSFESNGEGEYSFAGRVLAKYNGGDPLAVVEASGFRFFLEGTRAQELRPGERVQGLGSLVVDYYIWVEYVNERREAPDLFYNLGVRRIRRVQIPDSLVSRHATGKALPARVAPSEFGAITELQTMVGQEFDEEFYLLDLETTDLAVPRTFSGEPREFRLERR